MPDIQLDLLNPTTPTTTTDQVFATLHKAVVSLRLAPGSKVSETEIAKILEVSRQPVRDAFFRLSALGFLKIRPQRATLITRISKQNVLQAAFIRTALEVACLKEAIHILTDANFAELDAILDAQNVAIKMKQKVEFHELDETFHKRLCQMAGLGYAWKIIQDHKAHMDRVRHLSLSFDSDRAYGEHLKIMRSLRDKDIVRATQYLTTHLNRVRDVLDSFSQQYPDYFDKINT